MPLESAGYFYQQGSTANNEISASYMKRRGLFMDGNSYTTDEVTLAGLLYSDLLSNQTGWANIYNKTLHEPYFYDIDLFIIVCILSTKPLKVWITYYFV